jgi:hypothetical protein
MRDAGWFDRSGRARTGQAVDLLLHPRARLDRRELLTHLLLHVVVAVVGRLGLLALRDPAHEQPAFFHELCEVASVGAAVTSVIVVAGARAVARVVLAGLVVRALSGRDLLSGKRDLLSGKRDLLSGLLRALHFGQESVSVLRERRVTGRGHSEPILNAIVLH